VETGGVLWSREAPGAGFALPYPEGRFSPGYLAGDGTVLVQTSGRRWLLDTATGRRVHDAATSRAPWPRPPLVLDERTACLVPDPRHLVLCDTSTGRDLWTYTLPGATMLSGEPPSVVGAGDTLLLVTPTNFGYELQRLDRATGRPAWDRPRLLSPEGVDTAQWALDREAVYLIDGGTVSARSLADGRLLWERRLAGGTLAWGLRRTGDYLIASPSRTPRARFRFRWLSGTVQWERDLSLDGHGGFPVVCCDPKSGRVVQRLNFQAAPPRLSARFRGGDGITFLPEIDAATVLAPDPWPDVQLCGSGLVAAFGRRVWGLRGSDMAP
jgi:hypothetical protein